MTDNNILEELNSKFNEFFKHSDEYIRNIGNSQNSMNAEIQHIVTKDIPNILYKIFDPSAYLIKGSVGKGRLAKTPWIAILDRSVTTTTQKGVYIVFLFSSSLKEVYITLAQGTTGEKFGERLSPEDIKEQRNLYRDKLSLKSSVLEEINDLDTRDKLYKICCIYSHLWNANSILDNQLVLNKFSEAYNKWKSLHNNQNMPSPSIKTVNDADAEYHVFSIQKIIEAINSTNLIYSPMLIKRFAFSLMTKPFVILSGLAGSGKTQLAVAFAKTMCESKEQYRIVSVGADWTNREPLLGFPNALNKEEYVRPENKVLDLLIAANQHPDKPYFLILDEMNMSYVERYFADFLSVMESHDSIALWNRPEGCRDTTPSSISLPPNLFIIGTINVDETTYMFSPKVLDRANVIEFKISTHEMQGFLSQMKPINMKTAEAKCAAMGPGFVQLAENKEMEVNPEAIAKLTEFFTELKKVNAEFGYRSASEIFRFYAQASKNDDTADKMKDTQIIDAAIVQKLLPKLHGSRKKLSDVLGKLWGICKNTQDKQDVINIEEAEKSVYPLSADKIARMYQAAQDNGFTSFAEA